METPIGTLRITGEAMGVSEVTFTKDPVRSSEEIPQSLQLAVTQLKEYFNKERTEFNLKLNPDGTDFLKRVST